MILVNGEAGTPIRADDRGLAYGDGVFRTVRVRQGRPLHWSRQYAKLAHDCAALAIAPPDSAVLEREVMSACAGEGNEAAKIIVTRGTGPRGYRFGGDALPTRIVIAAPSPDYPASHGESGVRARVCSLRLSHQPLLAGIKHLNRLENVLARAEWSDTGIAEGILCDGEGNVVGGTMTNIFAVRGGMMVTPALDRCGVSGVTRDRAMAAAARAGIECRVERLPIAKLEAYDEIFLVNSLAGVWPVRALDAHERKPGPVTRSIQEMLAREDDGQTN